MTILLFLFLFTTILISISQPAELLVTTMDQGRSHISSFQPLLKTLQGKNHTVSIFMNAHNLDVDFGIPVNHAIDISDIADDFISGPEFDQITWAASFSSISQIFPFMMHSVSCTAALKHRREEFDRIANGPWNLIFTDSLFTVCGYGIATLHEAHHVMFHSSDVESIQGTFKAFHRNYGILPANFMKYSRMQFDASSFIDRTISTSDWLGGLLCIGGIANIFMSTALSHVLSDGFSFAEFNRLSSFSFTDMPDLFYPAAPRTNDYVSYGSYCKQPHRLQQDVENFVSDSNSKGTIVIAFGTMIKWHFAPPHVLEAFVEVINELSDYRIIWAYRGPDIKVGAHIRLAKWIPQIELLHHNRTVLFVSHGGLKSVKEAACSGTPSLFMPMFAEQMRNSWLAKSHGFAEIVSKFEITKDYLRAKIDTITSDSKHQLAANRIQSFILDRPIPSLDHAAFLVDRLLEYKGRMPNYFYPRSLDLSYIQTLNLDIFFAVSLLTSFLFLV